MCDRKIAKVMNVRERNKYRVIKEFILEKYYLDCRGYEIRKFFWVYQNTVNLAIKSIPYSVAREIAEFI